MSFVDRIDIIISQQENLNALKADVMLTSFWWVIDENELDNQVTNEFKVHQKLMSWGWRLIVSKNPNLLEQKLVFFTV